MHNKRELFNKA
jgi:hypothetical protein